MAQQVKSKWNGFSLKPRREMPEGLWMRCPGCEHMLYKSIVEKNLNVCPECNHHFRIEAKTRIDYLVDEGSFQLVMEDMEWHTVQLGNGSEGEFPDGFRPETDTDGSYFTRDERGRVMSRMPRGGMCFDQMLFPWEDGYPGDMNSIDEAFRSINWIAHSHSHVKGEIVVNAGARNSLLSDNARSLLPVGIMKVRGDFRKGDVIRILDEDGVEIGLGLAKYGMKKAKEIVGQKNQKPLVHYDHLYLH